MKIATWNIHHYSDAKVTGDVLAELVARHDLDIIFLQEVRSRINAKADDALSLIAKRLPGFDHIFAEHSMEWRGMKEGVATFSRLPIKDSQAIDLGDRNTLLTTIRVGNHDLETINVHLSPLNSFNNILRNSKQSKRLVDAMNGLGDNCVLAGDLNLPPRARLISELGGRLENISTPATWRNALIGRYALLEDKLDYIFVGGSYQAVVASVERVGSSDHFPVIAELAAR